MLTRLYDVENFRTFRDAWSPTAAGGGPLYLGRRTVIYGKNGSGKSTFAALAAQLASGIAEVSMRAVWNGATRRSSVGTNAPVAGLFVFDQSYVEMNLREFLAGQGDCDALIRLGAPQIEEAERQASLEQRLADLDKQVSTARASITTASATRDRLEQATKTAIIDALSPYDPARYGTATFRITHVRALLEGTLEGLGEDRAAVLAETRLTALVELSIPQPPSAKAMIDLRHEVSTAIQRPIESVSLHELDLDTRLSDWIREALVIHEGADNCKFCAGPIPDDLRDSYKRHFDRSREDLENLLSDLRARTDRFDAQWDEWFQTLPETNDFASELRPAAATERDRAVFAQSQAMSLLHVLRTAIDDRLASLSAPIADVEAAIPNPPDLTEYFRLAALHETRRVNLAESRRAAAMKIEADTAKRVEAEYSAAQLELLTSAATETRLSGERVPLQIELDQIRAARHDAATIAAEMNAAMASYFGHSHLSIHVSEEGNSYSIRRGTRSARNLSEGERNGIAFLYFLHSLRIEGVDPRASTIVIDDPVSSLDTDAIFATQNFIATELEDFQQVVVLTHNFDLFRLLWRKWVAGWEKSMKARAEGDSVEIQTPKVQFLEIRALQSTVGAGELRHSELREMPPSLLTHANEYHYLFHKVYRSAHDQDDSEAPLMANAARRLVEGFLAFKVPSAGDITSAYASLQAKYPVDKAVCDRVQNFTNTLSHRQDPNPQSSINFTGVQDELKYVLKLIRDADKHHYDGLVKATKVKA